MSPTLATLPVAVGLVLCLTSAPNGARSQTSVYGLLVEDHSGDAIAGGTIGLWRADTGRQVRELVADAEGRFEARGLPDGEYTLTTERRGYVPGTARVLASAGEGISLHLIRQGIVTGRLLPPAQARVELIERVPEGTTARRVSAQPNGNGDFRLWQIPTGQFDLVLIDPTVASQRRRGIQPVSSASPDGVLINGGEEIEGVDIAPALQHGYTVRASLSLVTRELRGSVFVHIVSLRRPVTRLPLRPTGEDNVWAAGDVLPDEYEVRASENVEGIGPVGELRGAARVSVTAADVTAEIPMTLYAAEPRPQQSKPGSITAEIDSTAAPSLAAVVVMDVTPGRDAPVRLFFARPGTTVTFDDLPPGRYYVAARDGSAADDRWAPEPGQSPPAAEVLSGVQTHVRLVWRD